MSSAFLGMGSCMPDLVGPQNQPEILTITPGHLAIILTHASGLVLIYKTGWAMHLTSRYR